MNTGTRIRAAIENLVERTRRGELQWHSRNPREWWQSSFMDLYRTTWPQGKTDGKKWALYVGPTRYPGMVPHEEFWIALLTDKGEVECRIACGGSELVTLLAEAKKSADQYLSKFLEEFLKDTEPACV